MIDPEKRYRRRGQHGRHLLIPMRPAVSEVRPDAWVFLDQATQRTVCLAPEQVTLVKAKSRREAAK